MFCICKREKGRNIINISINPINKINFGKIDRASAQKLLQETKNNPQAYKEAQKAIIGAGYNEHYDVYRDNDNGRWYIKKTPGAKPLGINMCEKLSQSGFTDVQRAVDVAQATEKQEIRHVQSIIEKNGFKNDETILDVFT